MSQNVPQITNIQQYHNNFRKVSQSVRLSPQVNRSCNDKICFILFLLITAVFLGLGIFFIWKTNMRGVVSSIFHKDHDFSSHIFIQDFRPQNIRPALPIMLAMFGMAVVLSFAFLCLLIVLPKFAFAFIIIFGFLSMLGVSGLFFYIKSYLSAIIALIIAIIFVIAIGFSFKKINKGLDLLAIASNSLKSRPSTLVAPFVLLIFGCSFFLFWSMSFAGILLYRGIAVTQAQVSDQHMSNTGVALLWIVFYLFYSFMFHYCLSFFIGTANAIWYYNMDENFLLKSVGRILRNHLGSFTYASLIVGLVFLSRRNFHNQSTSGIISCCLCCITCFLKCMQNIQQALNHNAIITMSVTGQSYFDSAKSTLSLIYDNFLLYFLVDLISHVLTIAGMMFTGGITAITGFLLLQSTAQNSTDNTNLVIGTIIICLFGMLVGGIFIGTFSQSLSSMFIFFCLDRKFFELGYPAYDNTPQPMRAIINSFVPYIGGQHNRYIDPNNRPSTQRRNSHRTHINPDNNQNVDDYRRGQLF